jgi:hypothetical protein
MSMSSNKRSLISKFILLIDHLTGALPPVTSQMLEYLLTDYSPINQLEYE